MVHFSDSHLLLLFSGIAFFLFGMQLSSQALEKLMANHISSLLNKLSQSQFLAIAVGVSLTTLLQSSGAVTSMLVSLGSARVIALSQVMGVIIGTAIGSTLTVQLISFDLSSYALPLFTFSFAFYFVVKKPNVKNILQVLMGFGLVFIGLGLISQASHFFASQQELKNFLTNIRENPYLSLFLSMCFCAFVHSSAVTIGLAMSLAQAGIITTNEALFWVYGANIGTTSTALFAAIGSNYIGKQVAWAHFFYKTLSVLLFLIPPIHELFVSILNSFHAPVTRSIANGHLIFNLISAAIFFPFIRPGARFIESLFPKGEKEEFEAKYLKQNYYQSSALAIGYANREILRTADIVISMIQDSAKLFETNDPSLIESIKDRDNKVDFLYREIKMFLLDHANKSTTVVHQNIMNMIMFLSDLERAADSIDINLITLSVKKHALKLEFSQEGWDEIKVLHEEVMRLAQLAVNSYQNRALCEEVIQYKRELAKLELQMREHHIGRLNRGLRESINTSSIHLDLLSEYKRIASLMCSHAYKQS